MMTGETVVRTFPLIGAAYLLLTLAALASHLLNPASQSRPVLSSFQKLKPRGSAPIQPELLQAVKRAVAFAVVLLMANLCPEGRCLAKPCQFFHFCQEQQINVLHDALQGLQFMTAWQGKLANVTANDVPCEQVAAQEVLEAVAVPDLKIMPLDAVHFPNL